jgi:transposase
MQFETVLLAEVPRLLYPDGHTEMLSVPWAEPHGRFTLLFQGWAVQVLQACSTVQDACELLRISWHTAHAIMEQAVERGIARRDLGELQRIGMDEKSFGRGQDYITIMTDLDATRVLEVVEGRDKESGCKIISTLPEQQRQSIRAAAIDMSESYEQAIKESLPQAEIVYDRFHVSKLLNDAVNEVRCKEAKSLHAEGDERLKGTRQIWLFNPANLSDARNEELQRLATQNLKTARAWLHKENFEGFWHMSSRWFGQTYLQDWYRRAIRSRLEPIKRCARTLKAHATGLLNYFAHRITNALCEGFNSKIQQIKAAARGFRTFRNYRTRILFYCGRLDMAL